MNFPLNINHTTITLKHILFSSEGSNYRIRNKKKLKYWLIRVAQLEKEVNILNINYILCDNPFILKINKLHLKHNYYTDVITYQYNESHQAIEADIYIGIDMVKFNAKKYGVPLEDELHRVMLHGLLHTLGYKDKTPKDKKEMRAAEDKYLKIFSTVVSRETKTH